MAWVGTPTQRPLLNGCQTKSDGLTTMARVKIKWRRRGQKLHNRKSKYKIKDTVKEKRIGLIDQYARFYYWWWMFFCGWLMNLMRWSLLVTRWVCWWWMCARWMKVALQPRTPVPDAGQPGYATWNLWLAELSPPSPSGDFVPTRYTGPS